MILDRNECSFVVRSCMHVSLTAVNMNYETMPTCLTSQLSRMQEITRPPRELRRMRENQLWSPVDRQEIEREKSWRSSIFQAVVNFYRRKTFGTESNFSTLKNVCLSALDLAFCIDNVIQLIKINVLMILTRFYNKESALRTCLLKEFRFRQKLAGMSECLL